MRRSGLFCEIACSLATRSGSATSLSCRKIRPSALMVTVSGWLSVLIGLASVLGRSTSTPEVISGAVTMKMMSSTSITSTSGVTLMSASGR